MVIAYRFMEPVNCAISEQKRAYSVRRPAEINCDRSSVMDRRKRQSDAE